MQSRSCDVNGALGNERLTGTCRWASVRILHDVSRATASQSAFRSSGDFSAALPADKVSACEPTLQRRGRLSGRPVDDWLFVNSKMPVTSCTVDVMRTHRYLPVVCYRRSHHTIRTETELTGTSRPSYTKTESRHVVWDDWLAVR